MAILLAVLVGILRADAPRWGWLGNDESLRATFDSAEPVAFVCVTEVELREVNPPFADVVYHATVIECHKGKLLLGERIQIVFSTDSLPKNDEDRRKFIESANKKNKGDLKFAFMQSGEDGTYFCDFIDGPTYTSALQDFLRGLQNWHEDGQGKQAVAPQSTPSPEPNPEDSDKP
ncbi:MAG: hypothetical protein MUF31_04445 [Akkermansiaceae bacterium]|jgi:hypothetical protein|nr:hypothetical protein [Akkermansiaceae bacterium]